MAISHRTDDRFHGGENFPPCQSETQGTLTSTGPAGNPPAPGVPTNFESRWQAFIARPGCPESMKTDTAKAIARMGYTWCWSDARKSLDALRFVP